MSCLAITIFSLAVCCSGVYAWFLSSLNKETSFENLNVSFSGNVEIKGDYRIFEYDFDNDTPKESETLKLHGYDCFIEYKNSYNKKYVVVDLAFPNGIEDNSALQIKMVAPTNNYMDGTKVAPYISNMVQFKYLDNKNSVVPITGRTASQIYNDCVSTFEDISYYDTFVTSSSSALKHVIDNTSSIPLPKTSSESVMAYTTQLIIEYTYNQDLIDYYKMKSGVNYDVTFFESGVTVNFSADIESIFFDVGTKTVIG